MDQQQKRETSRIDRIINFIKPPKSWKTPVIILLGIIAGLGLYIINISNAVSYLSNDPRTCVNCHVMAPQYATWERGSHGRVTTCNDCHVPQHNIIEKMLFKASDGLRHATMFTFRMEPQVIQIKDAGKKAVQENCIRCHTNNVHPLALRAINQKGIIDNDRYCWDCHRETPHGKVHSLSSTPNARVPLITSPAPDWIINFVQEENKTN